MKQATKAQLNEFAVKNAWNTRMNSGGLDSFNNYRGPDLGDMVIVVSRSRDSDTLQESNFYAALELLGGVETDDVQINRFGHWACGWVESIMINPKKVKLLKIAYDIKKLLEEYPVLDDIDYSERENEYQSEYAKQAQEELSEALSLHFGVKNTKALVKIAYSLNMECQAYYGNDSCINMYTSRKPDLSDIQHLKNCMEQMSYSLNKSRVFKQLQVAINTYKVAA